MRTKSKSFGAKVEDIVLLYYQYTSEEIEAAGIDKTVGEAVGEFSSAIHGSANLLKPFGVEYKDVLKLAEDAIKSRLKKK